MAIYCVPDLSSVPGSSGQFDWWSGAPDSTLIRYFPDNANWLGAFSISEGDGANRDMQFRALKGAIAGDPKRYLFLSWVVRVSDIDETIDRLNVVLGDGTNYMAFQVRLNSGSSSIAATQNDGIFTYRIHNCTVSGSDISQVNPAVSTDGADIEVTGRAWVDVISPGRGLETRWAFQVAIPLGAAWAPTMLSLPNSGAFKLWYEVVASVPGNVVQYVSPPGDSALAPVNTASFLQAVPSGLKVGHLLDLSTGSSACTAGVELSWGNVGARNVGAGDPARTGTTTIRLDLGQPYPPNMAAQIPAQLYDESHVPDVSQTKYKNLLFAQPTFPAGLNQTKRESIRARFSLANWGSQYSDPTANSWRPIPGCESVQYLDANGEAQKVWPDAADSYTNSLVQNINKYLNAVGRGTPIPATAQNPHQCMLVELTSTDPTVVITRSSVYQNMNVGQASILREQARISIEGLQPLSAQARDVYLYLQTFNMPSEVTQYDLKRLQKKFDPKRVVAAALGSEFEGGGEGSYSYEVEDVAAYYPTYIVHVYHDTGRRFKLENGSSLPVLRPQTAFGYFLEHKGSLVGWDARLYGAEKLADDFYRLRIRNNGAAYVEAAIQARESENDAPLPPDGVPARRCLCSRLIAWLESKGWLGRLIALIVRFICRLLGQSVS